LAVLKAVRHGGLRSIRDRNGTSMTHVIGLNQDFVLVWGPPAREILGNPKNLNGNYKDYESYPN